MLGLGLCCVFPHPFSIAGKQRNREQQRQKKKRKRKKKQFMTILQTNAFRFSFCCDQFRARIRPVAFSCAKRAATHHSSSQQKHASDKEHRQQHAAGMALLAFSLIRKETEGGREGRREGGQGWGGVDACVCSHTGWPV